MAAYETYETDKDYDTMEMRNTQAAERVIYISIVLVLRNVLHLIEWFRMALGKGSKKLNGNLKSVMKGAGEGVSRAINLFWKMIFLKKHLESFPDCENVFCT